MRIDPFAKKNSKPLLDAATATRPSLENAVKGSSPRVIVSRRKLAEPGEERAPAVQVRIQINPGGKPGKRERDLALSAALACPSHGCFAQQHIGHEGKARHQWYQPQTERSCALLGEPAEDRAPPVPIGAHQHKDAEQQKCDAKEDKLPRAAKALVDAAEQQSQQVHEQQEDKVDPKLLQGRATTKIVWV